MGKEKTNAMRLLIRQFNRECLIWIFIYIKITPIFILYCYFAAVIFTKSSMVSEKSFYSLIVN